MYGKKPMLAAPPASPCWGRLPVPLPGTLLLLGLGLLGASAAAGARQQRTGSTPNGVLTSPATAASGRRLIVEKLAPGTSSGVAGAGSALSASAASLATRYLTAVSRYISICRSEALQMPAGPSGTGGAAPINNESTRPATRCHAGAAGGDGWIRLRVRRPFDTIVIGFRADAACAPGPRLPPKVSSIVG